MSGIFLDIDCLLCQGARAVGIFAIILIGDLSKIIVKFPIEGNKSLLVTILLVTPRYLVIADLPDRRIWNSLCVSASK